MKQLSQHVCTVYSEGDDSLRRYFANYGYMVAMLGLLETHNLNREYCFKGHNDWEIQTGKFKLDR
jgi:hypothetical protein